MGLLRMSESGLKDAARHWGIVMHREHYGSTLHATDKHSGGIGPQALCDHCVFEAAKGIVLNDENRLELAPNIPPTAHTFVWKVTNGGSGLPKRADLGVYLMALNSPTIRNGYPYTL